MVHESAEQTASRICRNVSNRILALCADAQVRSWDQNTVAIKLSNVIAQLGGEIVTALNEIDNRREVSRIAPIVTDGRPLPRGRDEDARECLVDFNRG
jgi:hypothetical protein